MAVNSIFHTSNVAALATEQNLYRDLVIEAIQAYGHDVHYLDRTLVNEDTILGTDSLAKFNTQAKIEIGNIYKNKSEKEELRELVGDLYWEWDRMSSSGQETLEKIADLLGDREIVEDKYIFGEKANG